MADSPRVRVAGARTRLIMLAAVFLIPIAAVSLALTFRGNNAGPELRVQPQTGSYEAVVGTPLSVTAFRIVNTADSTVTIKRVRILKPVAGLDVIGALAYRGCPSCVVDSAVPPHITPSTDAPAPALLGVNAIQLKPGARLTLLLSVSVSRNGHVNVPPLSIDVDNGSGVRTIETLRGPELCAGKGC